jgi:hypothetical protein
MEDQFYYSDIHNNQLLQLLKELEFASALAYLVDFKNHAHLTITPHDYSIEISNNEITIVIILFSGFEMNEYLILKNKTNLNLISLSEIILEMCEFENMHVKYIDKLAWFFSVINRSENNLVKKINRIKNLRID